MIINRVIPILDVVRLGIAFVKEEIEMKVHEAVPQRQEGADMRQSERVKT